MKSSLTMKFIAVTLCAASLLTAVMGGLGIICLASWELLGDVSYAEVEAAYIEEEMTELARRCAQLWAGVEYGGLPPEVAEVRRENFWPGENASSITVTDGDGKVLHKDAPLPEAELEREYTFPALSYEVFVGYDHGENDFDTTELYYAYYDGSLPYFYRMETLTEPVSVKLSIAPGMFQRDGLSVLAQWLWEHQLWLFAAVLAGMFAFAVCAVYLCAAAGRRAGTEEIRAGGFNALPLDLYGLGVLGVFGLIDILLNEAGTGWLEQANIAMPLFFAGVVGYVGCLVFVGFCFACTAQFRMGGCHWFRNSILGRCAQLAQMLLIRFVGWLPGLWRLGCRILRAGWKFAAALALLAWNAVQKVWKWMLSLLARVLRRLETFFYLLPVMWQWLLVGMVLVVWLFAAVANRSEGNLVLWCCVALLLVLYGANAFGLLLDGVKKMRRGELESKVDDKYLIGAYREFAQELNGLADVAMETAQRQLRSERMKTELITNVSHDIKTPLTSIINYVDLLEKPHTEDEGKAYLEVLTRQSHRLKKLIEDLIELSRASTGNIAVEITRIDAVEAVNQALGEFSDKLARAGLTPVLQHPEEAPMLADGRLLWRTMSNILSNAVKYAMPGTRLYVDVAAVEAQVVISFKNVSGTQLNISADELLERFVRGDASRNTEGSGLGLNIAQSLMELQKGQLQLLVDGDLFKVTLIFPGVQ